MNSDAKRLRERMNTPEELENSISYMTRKLGSFLKRRERVLICLPETRGSVGWIVGQAVERCGGIPTFLGQDRRWKTMIRTAFSSRCGTIVAEPLVLLGLSKLAKNMGVPLFIRNALLAGYPCMRWMRDGIQHGLDCRTYGVFDPGGVVAGFIGHDERELQVRSDLFDVYSRNARGERLPDGEQEELILQLREEPELSLSVEYQGRVKHSESRIFIADFAVGRNVAEDIAHLSGHLHRWTSILDCRVTRGDYGLELEILTFPGEKLPKLPSCAKQVVRPWEPETDVPFSLILLEETFENH